MSSDRSRPERTSEERERDRLDRERRRAERAGTPIPAEPPPLVTPPPDDAAPEPPPVEADPPHVEPPGMDSEPAPAAELEPAPIVELPPAEASEHGPYAASELDQAPGLDEAPELEKAPAPDQAPDLDEAPGLNEAPDLDQAPALDRAPEPGPPVELDHASEPDAAPELRDDAVSSAPRSRSRRAGGYEIPGLPPAPAAPEHDPLPPPPPSVGRPRQGGRPAPRRGRRRPGRGASPRLLALVALVVVAAIIVLLVNSLKGGSSSNRKSPAVAEVKVLIPEGKTRLQIAQIAKAKGLTGSYRAAAKRSALLNPTQYGAPASTPDLEGFLFPATYDMNKGAPASRLVEEQVTAFQENFGTEDVSRARALGVTPYQLLTVASMVEREAQVPGDRAKIAAVIYNRLKAGMPLGIDATIYYAVELQKDVPTYTRELTAAELQIDSPYNTRTHRGLPPTPISNPGVASIQAAAHPARVSYLYYVAGADGCGEQVFSDTQAAFEANVAAYEEAKRKNGGHPPACKKK